MNTMKKKQVKNATVKAPSVADMRKEKKDIAAQIKELTKITKLLDKQIADAKKVRAKKKSK